jgi:SAM-dependent methyltransferase
MERFSDKYAHIYEAVSRIPQIDNDTASFYASFIPDGHSYDILDLGCAEGTLAIKLVSVGHCLVASDISNGYLNQTADKAQKMDLKLQTVQCDIEKDVSCFGSKKFDYIYFMDIIEHLRSPITALENIVTLLKPEGSLFINTPNACSLTNFFSTIRMRKKIPNITHNEIWAIHLQIYDMPTLVKLCNFAGLKVTRAIPNKFRVPKVANSKFLAKRYPANCSDLLIECKPDLDAIDVERAVSDWDISKYCGEQ